MSHKYFVLICSLVICVSVFGQTNNSYKSISINGNLYYFRPSTTSSSPQPIIQKSGFISEGSWYGEEAVKAWVSISNWAIENCQHADDPIKIEEGDKVFIHQVHAYRNKTQKGVKFIFGDLASSSTLARCSAAIKIFYWVVPANVSVEHGRLEYRRYWYN